jgi:hypothetical protein
MPYLLLHSPLLAAAGTWGDLPARLGADTLPPEIAADDAAPYAERYVDAVLTQTAADRGPLVAVPHSGAGPLLAAIAAAFARAGRPLAGAVFLDAGLPAPGRSRLDLLASEDAAAAAEFRSALDAGARYPDWTADLLAGEVPDPEPVIAALRPRGLDFYAEPLPDAALPDGFAAGYVQLSGTYASYADEAEARGWPTVRADLGHLAALSAPDAVADLIRAVTPERR